MESINNQLEELGKQVHLIVFSPLHPPFRFDFIMGGVIRNA